MQEIIITLLSLFNSIFIFLKVKAYYQLKSLKFDTSEQTEDFKKKIRDLDSRIDELRIDHHECLENNVKKDVELKEQREKHAEDKKASDAHIGRLERQQHELVFEIKTLQEKIIVVQERLLEAEKKQQQPRRR